ncbi:hypothetical protein GYA37_00700 [candidate division WWE3 bacterium]|uniref:Uncharacterized protein n=1 Tax=candidate division WWE3 bacterium TaxID=2053526 RepID=A0A7X9E6S5_UNCKA|nr:hypothetical protein [candidate division WWE3 bacterium]
MLNLYQNSNLLSKEQFDELESIFKDTWSNNTVFPNLANKWTRVDKALGQCVPTALIVYDLFGGKLAYDKNNFHVWNVLPDGTNQDFSRCQFKKPTKFNIYEYKTKDEILNSKSACEYKILERYQTLKSKVRKELKRLRALDKYAQLSGN